MLEDKSHRIPGCSKGLPNWLAAVKSSLPYAVLAASLPLLSACSSVAIHGAEVEKTIYPGVVILNIKPSAEAASLTMTEGVGLTVGVRSVTLGYLKESVFLGYPDKCSAFFVVADRQAAEKFESIMKSGAFSFQNICVVTTEGKR